MTESRTSRMRRFFKEVGVEMQKVTWPAKQEVVTSTTVVVIVTLLLTAYVGVIDIGMKWVVQLITQFGTGS